MNLLGIDTGGTFTDFVFYDGLTISTHKVLSTPTAPEQAILQGIDEMQIALDESLLVIHGSTVATNAVLEGKGAKTVYITNQGFKDVLTIGRQARQELYNLTPVVKAPPVPAALCLETAGRLDHEGKELVPLTDEDIEQLLEKLEQLKPESVAINFLFSYLNPANEVRLAAKIPDFVFVSRSSAIAPVYREYERGITTWLNAYTGPLMQGYLNRLQDKLMPSSLRVMRSSGQTSDAKQAGNEPVHLLLSGPAGGIAAAYALSEQLNCNKLLTFDMGGTSTDVAMIDGQIELTGQGGISGYPVGVPMVNIHTIGAGGGSIASVDEGGLLQVGPDSAGAVPGPACYGQGGNNATVTDANLILNRIPFDTRLGNSLTLDKDRALSVMLQLAQRLNLATVEEAALGIIRIANEHMAQALRVISVERGIDAREFTLMAFGGAGGLHVCELAEKLEMQRVIVPNMSGVLSALGMIVASPGRQLTKTLGRVLSNLSDIELQQHIDDLSKQAVDSLADERQHSDAMQTRVTLDLCYQGQAHTLEIDWSDINHCIDLFEQTHRHRYGYALQAEIELVNIRVGVTLASSMTLPASDIVPDNSDSNGLDNGKLNRQQLQPGQRVTGPLSICDAEATVWLAPGWQAQLDRYGHLLLNR